MKKIRKVLLAILLCVMITALFAACQPEVTYTYTLSKTSHSMAVGETVQLTVTADPAKDIEVTYASSNVAVATVSTTGLVTAVAAGSANITATVDGQQLTCAVTVTIPAPQPFEGVTEAAPTDNIFTVSAISNAREAKAVLTTAFGVAELTVTAWVEDASVVSSSTVANSDGVRLYLSEVSETQGYIANKTLCIFVSPDGQTTVQRASSATAMQTADSLATATAQLWARAANDLAGYKVVISVPFASLGVEATQAKGNISFAAELQNTSSQSFAATVRGYSLTQYGVDVANQNTYIVINDNNSYALNTQPYPTGTFNVKQNVYNRTDSYWDISQDYLSSDGSYADRTVTLNNSLGTGNNNLLYFYKAQSTLTYCESVFELPSNPVYLEDEFPKFGFCLIDSDNNGVFFFIAADTNTTGTVIGTKAGYCLMTGGAFDWNNAPQTNVNYSASSPVTLGLFRDGGMVKMVVDDEVIFTLDGTSGLNETDAIMPAVFSFNIGLKLTSYRVTTNPADSTVVELSAKAPAYAGEKTVTHQPIASNNYNLNLSELGLIDWAIYNGSVAPSDYKASVSARRLGTLSVANGSPTTLHDFLYENSSVSWTDGTSSAEKTISGNVAGLTLNGTGKFVYKLNVLASQDVTYYIWFGGFESTTNVKLSDAHGNVLYSEAVGSNTLRTVSQLAINVVPDVTTELTLELSITDPTQANSQVWFLAASCLLTADIPQEEDNTPAVVGNVTGAVVGLNRADTTINLTEVGTSDWVYYGQGSASNRYQKAGENGYIGDLNCVGDVVRMDDYFTTSSALSWTDGAAPDATGSYTGNIPGTVVRGASIITQSFNVTANQPMRYVMWATGWSPSVQIKVYDSENTWYSATINHANSTMIEVICSSSVDAVIKIELTGTEQVWLLGAAAAVYTQPDNIPSTDFTGTIKTRYTAANRASGQIELSTVGTKDWTYYNYYNANTGYLKKASVADSYFGNLVVDGKAAYPFADFFIDSSSISWIDGTAQRPTGSITGPVGGVAIYGNGSKATLPLYVMSNENFSYFLYVGGFNSTLTVTLKTIAGATIGTPVTVGSGTGAAVGCVRIDLSSVNESVIYAELSCAGQEIWLCAAAAGETPVELDVAFNGKINSSLNFIDRSNTTINFTELGTYDWNVYQDEYTGYAHKETENSIINPLVFSHTATNPATFPDFFYDNKGTISWTDGDADHQTLTQTGDFPGLQVAYSYRFSYAIADDFKGSIYVFLGGWTTVANVRITDSEGNLLDSLRFGDTYMGKMYCLQVNVDSLAKTTINIDVETVECGQPRNLWVLGTAVGSYSPMAETAAFAGNVSLEQNSFDRENYSLNMTEEGSLDWTAYNSGSITTYERKNIEEPNRYIGEVTSGAYTEIAKEDNFFYNNSGIISWTDGTTVSSFTSGTADSREAFPGIKAGMKSASYQIALKASATQKIVYTIYFGGFNAQYLARVYDSQNVLALSRIYGSAGDSTYGVDNMRLEITVASSVDTTIYAEISLSSQNLSYNVADSSLMLMGVTARIAAPQSAFDGTVATTYTELARGNATIDVTAAGGLDWRVYNKEDRFAYHSKSSVVTSYIGDLSFEGRLAKHFPDYLYQNQGIVSWTDCVDCTENAYTSAVGESIGGLTTNDTFVLKLNAKASTDVTYTVWLGGYNNPNSTYTLTDVNGNVLATGTFGNAGTGCVASVTFAVTNCTTDSQLILRIATSGQESWLFGAAANATATPVN